MGSIPEILEQHMTNPDELKQIFTEASSAVLQAYRQGDKLVVLEATPDQLIDAINQFFIIQEKLGDKPNPNISLNRDNISLIGEQTINCLADLAYWAEQLSLPDEAALLEEIALSVTHWVIRQRGEIRSLEAIVNLLADKVNQTSDKKMLTALFHVIKDVIQHTAEDLKSDPEKSDPNRPWRMLNFNYAIVATRTMNRDLMVLAFDSLGQNLPEDCPGFFEEGLRQSEKPVYGPEIKTIMAEYFKKWTVLH
jgi:hypothetical protein